MRKGLFAIVLIAAAFAGGAAVNGPGLQWARTFILKQTSPADDTGESAEEEPLSVGPVAASEGSSPTAPAPEDGGSLPARLPKKDKKATAKTAAAKSAHPFTEPKAPEPTEVTSTDQADARPPEAAKPGPEPAKAAPPLDELPPLKLSGGQDGTPSELPPLLAPSSAAPAPLPLSLDQAPEAPNSQASNGPAKAQGGPWADAPGSAPAEAVPPKGYVRPADRNLAGAPTSPPPNLGAVVAPTDTSATRASGDWTEIRRQMRELGVARYGIEGEPTGRVRFHCIIPLAGRRAVGQQFEAEGNDELQAARTALRRVALWRATENPVR